jgi:hypothetical protein
MTRLVVAATLVLCVTPVLAQSGDWGHRHREGGVHLRVLRDYRLAAGATAHEPIVVIGGSATIEGRAEGDVVVVGGTLRVGPDAVVRGSVVVIGGEAIVDPGARVSGGIDEVSVVGPDFGVVWSLLGEGWWAVAAFGATLVRLSLALLVALLLTLVAPHWVGAISHRATSVGTSALLGLTGQVLFIPALVAISIALLISVVGIPLLAGLPLLVGAAAIVWIAGFAAVAIQAGRRLRAGGADPSPVLDLITGFLAIMAITILAHVIALGPSWMREMAFVTGIVGLIVEYLVWTIGLGAAIASLFGRRHRGPPPVPIHASIPAR